MAKRSVGTPRFYADFGSYLKSLGYYHGADTGHLADSGNKENVWNMNPEQLNRYEISNIGGSQATFLFYIDPAGSQHQVNSLNKQLSQLLSNTNYAGILGHNLGAFKTSDGSPLKEIYFRYQGSTGAVDTPDGGSFVYSTQSSPTNTVNYNIGGNTGIPEYNGYSLWEIESMNSSDERRFSLARFEINTTDDGAIGSQPIEIGAFTFGRYFEPSHSPDLSVKLIKSYDGVDVQTTVGGSTITNFNHLGQPMWGDLPAWTLEKQAGHDYRIGAERGRRAWQVSFSYLADTDIFNEANNENKFFTWDEELGESGYTFDTSMASFFSLTHNGNLRFIFCPDKGIKNKEFALCIIDQDSLTYTQVAHRTWNVSMNIMEVW